MPSPDEILESTPQPREVRVEANVVAYFGDLLMAWKRSVEQQLKN